MFSPSCSRDILNNILRKDMVTIIRFIDLFAGIGGMRRAFEDACRKNSLKCKCVFTSEIKPHAVKILSQNYPGEKICGDITEIDADMIPNFDVLLAGFPCQAFSSAGRRRGFDDARGTLFFDVIRILKAKKPEGFILENVEGLVNHDGGRTFGIMLDNLKAQGYCVSYAVLDAKNFGVPQERRRIYIVGSLNAEPVMPEPEEPSRILSDILEHGLKCESSEFISCLMKHYSLDELAGKSIKDKRGGSSNIHSWDIELRGKVSAKQRELLSRLLTERRKKHWAEEYGIKWMDGMPLTLEMIRTFYDDKELESMLEDLVSKKYLVKEHPKNLIDGRRVQDISLPLGYNIVSGKISFQVSRILDPAGFAPTLVAMDMERLYVIDGGGIRKLSLREGLRLFGYPDDYSFRDITLQEGYDLLGNTVAVPVVSAVADKLLEVMTA